MTPQVCSYQREQLLALFVIIVIIYFIVAVNNSNNHTVSNDNNSIHMDSIRKIFSPKNSRKGE